MPKWRAQVRLPEALDLAIRDFSVKQTIKLQDLIEAMIRDGAETIRPQGAAYVFVTPAVWGETSRVPVEYVIDQKYNAVVESLTAGMAGAGKRGRALAEVIHLGAKKRGIEDKKTA